MVSISAFLRKHLCLLALVVLVFGLMEEKAYAATTITQHSATVGGGTLSWELETETETCGPHGVTSTVYTYYGFGFIYPGATFGPPYVNPVQYRYAPNSSYCVTLLAGAHPSALTLTFYPSTGGVCSIWFSEGAAGDLLCTSILDPREQVVSVLYAPPGNQSSDGYTDTTTNGSSSSIGSSITNAKSMTYSEGLSFGDFGVTASTIYGNSSQTSDTTQFQDTFTNAQGYAIQSNKFNPDAINHNLDEFLIWLNPEMTIVSDVSDKSTPVSYSVGLQAVTDGQTAQPDILKVPAIAMEALPGSITTTNPAGVSSVDPILLNQQCIINDATNPASCTYYPGIAAVCTNLNLTEYAAGTCTLKDQCGCTPSDFKGILATDPLLNYSNTANPLAADVSGITACLKPSTTTNCRYVPVPILPGSATTKSELLEGSACVIPNQSCDSGTGTFTLTDATTTTQTLAGQDSNSTGASLRVSLGGVSLTVSNQVTYAYSHSTGTSTGSGNSMTVTLNTSNPDCAEWVNVYEDTVFHTFVFQEPGGNNGCTTWPAQ
jgi:hypothetical protein